MRMKELFDDIDAGAKFSDDRKYRFALWRIWDKELPCVMFIGLNPSKANESDLDATIRSVIRISKHNGYGGFYMMNCFPMVSTNPDELVIHPFWQKINDEWIEFVASKCKDVVFAWGNFKVVRDKKRNEELVIKFPKAKVIGLNANGSPKHPLFIKGKTILTDYSSSGTTSNQ